MGITIGEIVFDIGGGIPNGKKFKAVQTGGPLGGCIPVEHLNVPGRLRLAEGNRRGHGLRRHDRGGRRHLHGRVLQVLPRLRHGRIVRQVRALPRRWPAHAGDPGRITEGKGSMEDIETIKEIAAGMEGGALCALGQLTPGPVMAALRYFEHEFITHIEDRKCPAGSCKTLVEARCINACPAGVDVPTYVALTAQGRYAEALEVHRARNPFALACGRVCPAFCESRCRRGDIDEPVAIRSIKRFMADEELKNPWTPATEPDKGEKVAVVGAGPAGLTAALRLRQMGYGVTVFEALPVAGGMMAVGIPEYRLPRDILQEEIEQRRPRRRRAEAEHRAGPRLHHRQPDERRRLQGGGPGHRRAPQPQAGHRRRGGRRASTTASTSCATWPWARSRT